MTTTPRHPATEPLAGYTVGITAERRRHEFGEALQRRGAAVLYAPAIRILPLADDIQLREATDQCLAGPLDVVIAMTGVGFRGWLEAADGWGLAGPLHRAIGDANLLARGPKARGAIRAAGLREAWSPESESSDEVVRHVIEGGARGKRIAVQLHGEPMIEVAGALREAGAEVVEVPVYRWTPPEDPEPLRELVRRVAQAAIDIVTFTSAPAAVSFLRTADELQCGEAVRQALREAVVPACVGLVTAAPLEREGIASLQPARARLGALVREIAEQAPQWFTQRATTN